MAKFDIKIDTRDLEKIIRRYNWRGKNFDRFLFAFLFIYLPAISTIS